MSESNRNEFELQTGRTIHLVAIDQWETYSGLLEGVPTMELNQKNIAYSLKRAQERWHFEPFLIQPTETPIKLDGKYPFGTPASIPKVTCIAKFDCFDTARDKSMHGSTLPIVWFQSDFAFPIEEAIQEQIRLLDWEKYAFDFIY